MRASPLMSGVLAPVVTPFKPDYTPDRDRYLKHCRWLAAPKLRPRRFRDEQRSQFIVARRTDVASRHARRSRRRREAHDARHRLLLDPRHGAAHETRRRPRRGRRPDAAAFLLQERERRRPLSILRRDYRSRRRRSVCASISITSRRCPRCLSGSSSLDASWKPFPTSSSA